MSVVFECRHCANAMGTVSQNDVTDAMLGIDLLSDKEQAEMIQYKGNGDMYIKSICEQCEETLGQHPEFHELNYFIQ